MITKNILITGATGKIGTILTKRFLSLGHTVIGTARTSDSASTLKQNLKGLDRKLTIILVDLCKNDGVENLCEKLAINKINPEYLINNARCIDFLKIEEDGVVSPKNFLDELHLDVVVPYRLSMLLHLQKNSQLENIVNIGSQYGCVAANPNLYSNPAMQSPIHYSVAKSALNHLTKELAVRLAPKNIRVNCIAYGGLEGRVDELFKERYAQLCPQKKMLTEDEIAGPVEMLLSPNVNAITGQTILADGGWTLW